MECSTFMAEVHVPAGLKEVEAQSLAACLQRVMDKRRRRGKRYQAAAVLTLMILAKLSGETKMSGIVDWVRLRVEGLAKRVPLRNGKAPCENTYRYVCNHVDVEELNQVLGAYFEGLTSPAVNEPAQPVPVEAPADAASFAPTHLALDGKSLRGTRRTGEGTKATVHAVGLYNVTKAYMWKQATVVGKGQERKAALAVLEPLDLHGTVVSADALHTQPKWAQAILDRHGDYLLMAKRNQSELCEAIALLFSRPPQPFLFPEGEARSVDKGHGRVEIRHLRVSSELCDYLSPRWPHVAQVFRVDRTITRQGKTTLDTTYGLTSLTTNQASPSHLLTLVRQHWHIENRNHWRRDVTLGEDACLVTAGQVPHVLALLNNTVLALVDFLKRPNLAAAIRYFNAFPEKALDLLLLPTAAQAPLLFV